MHKQVDLLQRLFGLEGKVVLVTGASSGIGRALALAFGAAGGIVGVHGQRIAELQQTASQIEAAGGKAAVLPASLGDVAECRRLIAETVETMGRLDVLVNCAGMNRRKAISEVTEDDFDTIVAVNLRSVFFLSQAAHVHMRAQGGGKIVNIGSVTSTDGLGGVSVYGATKAGLAQLTRTMALEWAKDNIQVNCLAPGFIQTPLTEQGLWGDAWRRQWLLDRIPAGRPGLPEDLIATALLLSGSGSAYLTGQVLNVDGGYLAGGSWLREDG